MPLAARRTGFVGAVKALVGPQPGGFEARVATSLHNGVSPFKQASKRSVGRLLQLQDEAVTVQIVNHESVA
jgi:hypothetical protein